jgi:phosphoribosylglycinamide formyltransferase-1
VTRLALGVLASGTGSNFEAIVRAIEAGAVQAEVRLLVCNRPGARVLEIAAEHGIATQTIDHRRYADRTDFDAAVADALTKAGAQLIVMAGFDRLVTATLLTRFPNHVINIHPALLPAFKGLNAQEQAARYGVTITGATVHLVDEHVDHGPIIVQAAVPIVPGEAAESVRRRVLQQEHRIFPYAIQLFAEGRVRVDGRIVSIVGYDRAPEEALIAPSPDV